MSAKKDLKPELCGPGMFCIDNFVDDVEIATIKKEIADKFKASNIRAEDNKASVSEQRTSSSALLSDDLEISLELKKRTSQITGYPISHIETLQVVRYSSGQK
jgi:hypothetical protein